MKPVHHFVIFLLGFFAFVVWVAIDLGIIYSMMAFYEEAEPDTYDWLFCTIMLFISMASAILLFVGYKNVSTDLKHIWGDKYMRSLKATAVPVKEDSMYGYGGELIPPYEKGDTVETLTGLQAEIVDVKWEGDRPTYQLKGWSAYIQHESVARFLYSGSKNGDKA